MNSTRDLRITAAAVNFGGRIWTGKRHADIMRQIWDDRKELVYIPQDEQGFVDQHGKFWNRFQAGAIAFSSGQTKERHETLLSEHVW